MWIEAAISEELLKGRYDLYLGELFNRCEKVGEIHRPSVEFSRGLTCIIHEGTASGCWEREDAGGSVILVAWPCC
jgi:hypothetical protein